MLHFFNWYIKRVDQLNEWIGNKISWFTTLLVLLICYDVIMRYLFNQSAAWIFELEWHLFAAIFLIGAAFTLKHDRHVRVDVFYSRFSVKQKAWVNLVGTLIFLIPFCLVIIDASLKFVGNSFRLNESSPDPGGLPARYIIKSAIPIGFILLFLQSISLTFKSLLIIFNKANHKS
ncbi:TRAP transporter small permease subunit [Fulvivirgaceae bacterium BMA10]|uniref:TRAP transporter small permease subunit n=1 Tax=Splendidivirga corallicola TaxID=3051826 RepID=A0ABT8KRZ1_9BACT|nr:TRAP transporter small permease subunit [Fulvivirgaceae bacterium BMA10]